MILITEYISKNREERQSHLDLKEPCIEIGGNSTQFKALLAYVLKTTIPHGNKDNVILCHACHNGKCSNPKHLYWGTRAENNHDRFEDEKKRGVFKTINYFHEKKIGEEEFKIFVKLNASNAGKKGGKNNTKPKTAEHKRKISESLKRN